MLIKGKKDLIIVPFDFTEQSNTALIHASKIALQNEDEVRLLHIISNDTENRIQKIGLDNIGVHNALEKFALENETVNKVKTTFHYEVGNFLTAIGTYLKTANADLCVMGTHGVHGMQHIIGANSLKVVTSSPVPIVVVQKKKIDSNGYKQIVIPIDGNNRGKNKIAYAVAIAKYFNSHIYIFEAIASDKYTSNRIAANSKLATDYLFHNHIPFTIARKENTSTTYAKQLVKYAVEIDADLIVISSHHDQDGVLDFFFEKTEIKVINNEPQIAIMCVNPIEPINHLDIASFNW